MAATPKPRRKAQKEFSKKVRETQGISRKEAMQKSKMSGAGRKFNEYGMEIGKKTKKVK